MAEELNNPLANQENVIANSSKKWIGIMSYLTIFGWIVAIVLNNNQANKTTFGSFHIRQSLGLQVIFFVLAFMNFIPLLGQFVFLLGCLFLLALWITGFIGALKGELKLAPTLGTFFQKWFANL